VLGASAARIGRRDLLRIALGADPRERTDTVLVTVFLGGGADGLHLVAPYAEPRYQVLRPNLGLRAPDDARAPLDRRALDLDGRFGLHPRLAPLLPAWRAGELAIVHAVGSDDETRSHFEATDRMEHAGAKDQPAADGWLARHLRTRPGASVGALSAVAIATAVPESLRGAPSMSAVESISDYRLGGGSACGAFAGALASLYARPSRRSAVPERLGAAGRQTLRLLERLATVPVAAPGVGYPDHAFGRALAQVARLVAAVPSLEVAAVNLGNWDSHFVQDGFVPDLMDVLARGLAAFRADLGEDLARVEVIVMTEFGRRAYENGSFGTDHGRGSVMLALGGGVAGGRVVTDWPGLDEDRLVPPGDLAVTIDYRDVLAELVGRRLGNPHVDSVFPGFVPTLRGIWR